MRQQWSKWSPTQARSATPFLSLPRHARTRLRPVRSNSRAPHLLSSENSNRASRPDLRRCTTKPRLKQHDQPTLRRMTRWHIIHLSTPRTDGARQCIATTSVQPRTARRTFPKPHCASSSEANCHTVRAEEEWRRSKRSADQPSGGYEPRPRGSYHGSSARAPTGESPCDLVIGNQASARSPSKITFSVIRVSP